MAKTYYGMTSGGTHPLTEATKLTAPPASGPMLCLTVQGPTGGKQWNYSGAVNGTTSFYIVDNGPTLGRQLSAS